jgi:hypothetical protein
MRIVKETKRRERKRGRALGTMKGPGQLKSTEK